MISKMHHLCSLTVKPPPTHKHVGRVLIPCVIQPPEEALYLYPLSVQSWRDLLAHKSDCA